MNIKYQMWLFLGLAVINLTVYPAATISSELSTIEALEEKQEKERQLRQFSQTGSIFMVDSLIAGGVDVNSPDTNGNTALMNAAKSGYQQIVQALIKAGADIDATNARGETALILATLKNHANVARILLEAKKHNNRNISSNVDSLLLVAVKNHNDQLVAELIAAGVNLNATDEQGFSALINAIFLKDESIVKQLLLAGADLSNINDKLVKIFMLKDEYVVRDQANKLDMQQLGDLMDNIINIQQYELLRSNNYLEVVKSMIKPEIMKLLEAEPARRKIESIKKRQEAVKKITSQHLLPVISNIVTEYAVHDYDDVPESERL